MIGEVMVFHPLVGLRPGIRAWCERLAEAAASIVHTPDLYDGRYFGTSAEAAAGIKDIGFDGVLDRAATAASTHSSALFYVGFSNGGACAELLAATRPGALGAVMIASPLPIKPLGWSEWPSRVPVQVHFSGKDQLRQTSVIDDLAARVRRSNAPFEEFLYEGSGHIFVDPDLPGYNEANSELLLKRVASFARTCLGS